MFSLSYSSDLNPFEMAFSMIKRRLDMIIPRVTTIADLKSNIDEVMRILGELLAFYRDF